MSKLKYINLSKKEHFADNITITDIKTLTDLITSSDYKDNKWYDRTNTSNVKNVAFSESFTTTNNIMIINTNLGDNGAEALAGVLPKMKKLTTICLRNNGITSYGAIALFNEIINHDKIIDIDFGGNSIGDAGANKLAEILPEMTNLKMIYLCNSDIGENGVLDLVVVLPTSIEDLLLADDMIGDKGARAVAGKSLPKIMELRMDYGNIGKEGAVALAGALTKMNKLEYFYFGGNNIEKDGAVALAGILSNMPSLKRIYLERSINSAELRYYHYIIKSMEEKNKSFLNIDIDLTDYDLVDFNNIDINNYSISDDNLFLQNTSNNKKLIVDFSSNSSIDLSNISDDKVKVLLYDIVSAYNIVLAVPRTILNDIPITPIYKSIYIIGKEISEDSIKQFCEKLNKVYEFTDKNALDYPTITYNDTTKRTNEISPLPSTAAKPTSTSTTPPTTPTSTSSTTPTSTSTTSTPTTPTSTTSTTTTTTTTPTTQTTTTTTTTDTITITIPNYNSVTLDKSLNTITYITNIKPNKDEIEANIMDYLKKNNIDATIVIEISDDNTEHFNATTYTVTILFNSASSDTMQFVEANLSELLNHKKSNTLLYIILAIIIVLIILGLLYYKYRPF
jgi:Ran GTPase-activating protein (RanGAP) involved in mRNA processing and transport